MRRRAGQFLAVEQDTATVGRLQPGQHAQECRLPAAGGPEQSKELALEYVERQLVDRSTAGESLAHRLEPHQLCGRHHWRMLRVSGEPALVIGRSDSHALKLDWPAAVAQCACDRITPAAPFAFPYGGIHLRIKSMFALPGGREGCRLGT